jgi:alkylhydroperoxidase family enzyme
MLSRLSPLPTILALPCCVFLASPCSLQKAQAGTPDARVPLLSSPDAWKRLPAVEQGEDTQLPTWARALADTLPHTTVAMLEADFAYRTGGSLDPRFAASLRWAVAQANQSVYGQAVAEADLRRAGGDPNQLRRITEEGAGWSAAERAAFAFARKMALAAYSVTDDEVKHLTDEFGDKRVVAVVLQIAYCNFQNRLTTLLRLPVEEADTRPPIAVKFKKPADAKAGVPAAPRPRRGAELPAKTSLYVKDKDWNSFDIGRLKSNMEEQRARKARIRIPTWDEVVDALPPGSVSRDKPSGVRWSLVVMGYQPQQGPAWLKCLRTFGTEAKQNRVLEESVFWVVTRNLQCFY